MTPLFANIPDEVLVVISIPLVGGILIAITAILAGNPPRVSFPPASSLQPPAFPTNHYFGQYSAIFLRKNSALRWSWSIPSTPSSMLIQPSKPTPASDEKIAS